MGRASFTYLDHSIERSNAGVYITDLSAANFDAVNLLVDDLVTAIGNVTLGLLVRDQRIATITKVAPVPPADEGAQRENKWLVHASDDVTALSVTFELPCANPVGQILGNTDFMDLGVGTDGETLKSAIEAVARSNVGNTVTVTSIEYVGRNI